MNLKRSLVPTLLFVCCASCTTGQTLPSAKRPEDIGFSSERLARIAQFFQGDIDKGAIPGATLLVSRDGPSAIRTATRKFP
jgi:hypothetical protein